MQRKGGPTLAACCEEEMGASCFGNERTCGGGEAMRPASLKALEARTSLGKKEAFLGAAVKHVLKWNGGLEKEVRKEECGAERLVE